jgi:hypothetical protein
MTTTESAPEKPARTPLALGLNFTERKLLERMHSTGARLMVKSSSNYGELWTDAGQEAGPRVQWKVTKRLENRGYLSYRYGGYDLSEAGRTAVAYLREQQQRRKL